MVQPDKKSNEVTDVLELLLRCYIAAALAYTPGNSEITLTLIISRGIISSSVSSVPGCS